MDEVEKPDPKPTLKLPFKVRFQLAAHTAAMNASKLLGGTVRQQFVDFMDSKAPPSPTTPVNGVTSADFTVDKPRNLWFRLYNPSSSSSSPSHPPPQLLLPTVVFYHGGGFVYFSAHSRPFDDMCRRLALELPAFVVSVNYRLAPLFRYPCQYHDGFDALQFMDSPEFPRPANMDLSRVFLSGDSAGGNLAHHVAVRAGQHEFKELKIVGMVLYMPFFGGEERTESEKRLVNVPLINPETTDWMWRSFVPEGADRDHAAVNVFGANGADISALPFPSTVVFIGGFDPLQDRQRRYVEWLKGSGKDAEMIEYPSVFHGCYTFPEIKENGTMIHDFREFIKKHSDPADPSPPPATTSTTTAAAAAADNTAVVN
uniref:Alpha/beta hydrolase fold-3 domain-containing protein n=1 Tax=Kalanchoe fedtschenkoi TaxID=63787 RepID=A0A7N0ZZI6_KALFE